MKYLLPLLLAGCSTLTPPDTVYVPVSVPCVSAIPDKPVSEVDAAKGVVEQIRALLVDRERNKIYTSQLESQLEGCK